MLHDIVVVEWKDSAFENGWQDREAHQGCDKVISVGILVKDSPHSVTLTTSTDPDDESGEVMSPLTIPKCAIVDYKVVPWTQLSNLLDGSDATPTE